MPAIPASAARLLVSGVALAWVAVQFVPFYTGGYEYDIWLLGTHVGAACCIIYLTVAPGRRRRERGEAVPLLDVGLALVPVACVAYLFTQGERIATRIEGVDAVLTGDYLFGVLLIVTLLEACRRSAGIILTAVAVVFIVYIFTGPYLPDALSHRGMTFKRFIDLQVLSSSAIFGTPVSASAHMVFYFVMVGAFLERSGAGKLFVSIAYRLTRRAWGGAGKASVISSALFGTVSGSAVANVLLSGVMTIPLMKRARFSPTMAGAIEATASTGGQLAPPIMGAAAFILADVVGVPYATVVAAAIVPAILYYGSLFTVVHLYSRRHGLEPDHSLYSEQDSMEFRVRWHLLLPLGLMVTLLIAQYSLMTVGIYTIVAVVVVSFLRRATRMDVRAVYEALIQGARSASNVAIPSAVAGIIVGTLVQTGLALRMQQWLLGVAGDSLVISLGGAMILTMVLGMGMPTAAAYLVSAILVAPALQELGVPALPAHLFILYFGILSMVTPPVALSAYAAAGISGSGLWNTGMRAFLLAAPGFIIPYAFVLNPALLLQGAAIETARVVTTAGIGVVSLAAASAGFLFRPMHVALRVVLFLGGVLVISPQWTTDTLGGALILLVVAAQAWRRSRERRAPTLPDARGEGPAGDG